MSKRRALRALIAGGVAATLGLSGLVGAGVAFADSGDPETGGGGRKHTGTGGDASNYIMVMGDDFLKRDHPTQGWGQASTDYWINQMGKRLGGAMVMKDIHRYADPSCNTAMSKAIARSKGQSKRARVVGLYMTLHTKNVGKWFSWGVTGENFVKRWGQSWNEGGGNARFVGYESKYVQKIYDRGLAEAQRVAAAEPQGSRVVCIALNEYEPAGYELQVSTAAQASPGLAGGAEEVHDQIRTSPKGSGPVEDLGAQVVLNWDGFQGSKAKAVTKPMTVKSTGTFGSPKFTPKDFGWNSWAAGKYWYDIKVARQKAMAKAVDTPDRVASETFELKTPAPVKTMHDINGRVLDPKEVVVSAMPYLAKTKGHTSGVLYIFADLSWGFVGKFCFITCDLGEEFFTRQQ